ncbi:DUF3465 domain-containing protein [Kiritimatiellota bacterium B12222]|nr:DUF3465 domain-containing protein [Kiritimatiellota bacterium B12222]
MNKGRKRSPLTIAILLLVGLFLAYREGALQFPSATTNSERSADSLYEGSQVVAAYQNRQSNVQVEGQGEIVHILPDDTQGSRHQKFILRINDSLTILIAHNIDLAPRVDPISVGDQIAFYGEYEWNQKGGVVHWTHHDPGGRHPDGWLQSHGQRFE